jgi:hypothetical protein
MSLDPELGATINSYRGEVGLLITANGGVSAYHDNIIRTVTAAGGVLEVRRDDSVDTTDCYVAFTHANGVERGWIGIASEAHGAGFRISGETAGGTFQNILTATPGDNDTIIYSNGISAIIARDDNTKINGSLTRQMSFGSQMTLATITRLQRQLPGAWQRTPRSMSTHPATRFTTVFAITLMDLLTRSRLATALVTG